MSRIDNVEGYKHDYGICNDETYQEIAEARKRVEEALEGYFGSSVNFEDVLKLADEKDKRERDREFAEREKRK